MRSLVDTATGGLLTQNMRLCVCVTVYYEAAIVLADVVLMRFACVDAQSVSVVHSGAK